MRSRSLVPLAAIALIGALASCDDDDIAGLEDLPEAFEEEATWVANLTAEVQGAPATATGRAFFVDRGNTIDYYIEYSGLSSPTTNAHIHRVSTAGVMVQLPFVRGATSGAVIGTIDMTRLDPTTGQNDVAPLESGLQSAAAFRADLANGATYVNIHSQNFTGGEIRGTIRPVP